MTWKNSGLLSGFAATYPGRVISCLRSRSELI
jgi:hypothetical protein